jgi:hypothetical protein
MCFAEGIIGLPRNYLQVAVKTSVQNEVRKKFIHLVCAANDYFLSHRAGSLAYKCWVVRLGDYCPIAAVIYGSTGRCLLALISRSVLPRGF